MTEKTQINTMVISLILAVGLMTGPALAQSETNGTAEVTTTALQKEKMPAPMTAGKKKGCKCRMMGQKDKAPMSMMGCRGMMGGALMKRMSDEQRQKFLDETAPLRRQMIGKRFDFMEALRNPKTTAEDLAKIEKEMLELRIKMLNTLINSTTGG